MNKLKNMENMLASIQTKDNTPTEWQPSLIMQGTARESLAQAMSYRAGKYQFRKDLDGLVNDQSNRPIVELPYPELVAIVCNPSPEIVKDWENAK